MARMTWVLAAAMIAGCAGTKEQAPAPVPVAPPPVADWLEVLSKADGITEPVASARIPLGPIAAPTASTPVVVVGPTGITFEGTVVVRAGVIEERIEAPAAQGRRIGGHAVIGQLFDAAKARNPAYSFNAPGGTTGPRQPIIMITDARAPISALVRAHWSVWLAGWEPSGWVVRGADGAPHVLAVEEPPVCRRSPAPRVQEFEASARSGSPSGIAIAASAVIGQCDAASQDQIFRGLAELLGTCWGRTVSQVQLLQDEKDEATISWVTSPDGSVEGVFAESSFLGYGAEMGDCVLRAVKSKRHATPKSGRCLGTTRLTYQSGDMADRLIVEPRVGEAATLAAPLRHAECRLTPGTLGFDLAPSVSDKGCGAGGSVWAQIDRTGIERLPDWLAEVAGAGGTDLTTVNLRVDDKATLGDALLALDALGRSGTKPVLRMGVD